MNPSVPRFVLTPYNPAHPRGKWTIWDHGTGKRYEAWGEQEAKGLVAEIQRMEVMEFLALETGSEIVRRWQE